MGKRASERPETDCLDWALVSFSGYITADELYDGPFCVLSIVDNRTFKRIFYQVLEHDPAQADIVAFSRRFQAALAARNLAVQGMNTDGSSLYPAAMAEAFGAAPHQVCEYHVLGDPSQRLLHVVAKLRKTLAERKPPLGRGRPTSEDPLVNQT